MSNQAPTKKAKKRGPGRPATGVTKGKLSATVNLSLLDAANKQAAKTGEGLSNFVSRAIQNLLLES